MTTSEQQITLTEGVMKEINTIFCSYDYNGDGQLSKSEFKRFGKSMGEYFSRSQLNEALSQLDLDGDGGISLEEFTKYIIQE